MAGASGGQPRHWQRALLRRGRGREDGGKKSKKRGGNRTKEPTYGGTERDLIEGGSKEARVERGANAAAATHVGAASHFTPLPSPLPLPPPRQPGRVGYVVSVSDQQSDRPTSLRLLGFFQLCLGGLGLPARRLQQETLWFGGAGESPPVGGGREGSGGEGVGLMSHDTPGVVRSSAPAQRAAAALCCVFFFSISSCLIITLQSHRRPPPLHLQPPQPPSHPHVCARR